jgi:cobalt-zinc-cadmium efflux system membrane fusion protein
MVAALIASCGKDGGEAKPDEEAEDSKESVDGTIELTAAQVASAKIATAKSEKRSQTGLLSATAEVVPAGDAVARIGPRVAGRITSLKAGVGDHVERGQILASLDSSELGRAKADYLSAVATWKVAQGNAEREKVLSDKKISSERDLRQAEAEATKAKADQEAAAGLLRTMGVGNGELSRLSNDGQQTSGISVTAPIAGEIVERGVTLGQMAQPSDTMFVIMDLRTVWVLVDVYERDLSQVKVGQSVEARVAAYPDRAFKGTVAAIGAVVEPKTRAVPVRVVLPNTDAALKPGMFSTVELAGTSGVARDRVVVPAAAVQRDGDRTVVFVPRGEHGFAAQAVKAGRDSGGWIEIEEGLAAGETVVTTGSFVLKSELRKGEMGEE